jgi:hypothetical protein
LQKAAAEVAAKESVENLGKEDGASPISAKAAVMSDKLPIPDADLVVSFLSLTHKTVG